MVFNSNFEDLLEQNIFLQIVGLVYADPSIYRYAILKILSFIERCCQI